MGTERREIRSQKQLRNLVEHGLRVSPTAHSRWAAGYVRVHELGIVEYARPLELGRLIRHREQFVSVGQFPRGGRAGDEARVKLVSEEKLALLLLRSDQVFGTDVDLGPGEEDLGAKIRTTRVRDDGVGCQELGQICRMARQRGDRIGVEIEPGRRVVLNQSPDYEY